MTEHEPDLVILDMQIGNMGGIAVAIDLRLEESAGRLPDVPILLLLDREADRFLGPARRRRRRCWSSRSTPAPLRRTVKNLCVANRAAKSGSA